MILDEIQQTPLNLAQRKYIIEQGIETLAKNEIDVGPDLRKLVSNGYSHWQPQRLRVFLNALVKDKGPAIIDIIETL